VESKKAGTRQLIKQAEYPQATSRRLCRSHKPAPVFLSFVVLRFRSFHFLSCCVHEGLIHELTAVLLNRLCELYLFLFFRPAGSPASGQRRRTGLLDVMCRFFPPACFCFDDAAPASCHQPGACSPLLSCSSFILSLLSVFLCPVYLCLFE